MPTAVYGLVTGKTPGETLGSTQANKLGDTAELFYVQLAELFGAGCFRTNDFNATLVPGELALEISGGAAFVGDAGERKLVVQDGSVTLEAADGVADAATNWFWLNRDTGAITATQDDTPPAESILLLTAVFAGGEATSVDNLPTGRTNLLPLPSDGKVFTSSLDSVRDYLQNQVIGGTGITITEESDGDGGKRLRITCTVVDTNTDTKVGVTGSDTTPAVLNTKLVMAGGNLSKSVTSGGGDERLSLNVTPHVETFTAYATVPAGTDAVVEIDFSAKGSYAGDYFIRVDTDEDGPLVEVLANGRTGDTFRVFVSSPADADAGSYDGADDLQLTGRLEGFTWTPGAGGAVTVSVDAVVGPGGGAPPVPLGAFGGPSADGSTTAAPFTWPGAGCPHLIAHRDCVITGYSAHGAAVSGNAFISVLVNASVEIATLSMNTGAPDQTDDGLSVLVSAGDTLSALVGGDGACSASIVIYGYFL